MSSDSFGRPADGPFQPSRRRFVQGLAAGGTVAGLGLWPRTSWAMKSPGQLTVLSGTEFDLAIGETLVNFRSEEHTSELQSLMRISYAVFCLKKKNIKQDASTKYI